MRVFPALVEADNAKGIEIKSRLGVFDVFQNLLVKTRDMDVLAHGWKRSQRQAGGGKRCDGGL